MSYKSEAQVTTLLQEYVRIRNNIQAALSGQFTTDVNSVSDAINAGDDTLEDKLSLQALDRLIRKGEEWAQEADTFFTSVIPHIGRLIGAPNLYDTQAVISKFNDYLVDTNEYIESRGLTKFSALTADPGNTGTPKSVVLNTDPASIDADISHIETLTFRCTQDATQGATSGKEVLQISGEDNSSIRYWDVGVAGSGTNGTFKGSYGAGQNEWPATVIQANGEIAITGSARAAGNKIVNGDFETPISGSGTSKLSSWTFTSGDTVVVQAETAGTDLISASAGTDSNGGQPYSLKTTGNFSMYQNLPDSELIAGQPYALSVKIMPINGGSGTVTGTFTVTVKSRDDATTYATVSITVGSQSVNTVYHSDLTSFILPYGAKPLKVVVALASIGGTAATPTVAFDDVILGDMVLVEGRAIAFHDGQTVNSSEMVVGRVKYNDLFTAQTLSTEAGITQIAFNEVFQRYLRHQTGSHIGQWNDPS